ncbi:hypothetical protein BpHYR1_046943 [Brachionus plicatilis]|uniref:Uncharacterized protein n=1 Tax=Brachionus plicatilis TaxID=10195 RepID=A0A3M7RGD8_BRAPC|nr:hypothetical protein BpHYR1_046943 [Brachionus plicatilis]
MTKRLRKNIRTKFEAGAASVVIYFPSKQIAFERALIQIFVRLFLKLFSRYLVLEAKASQLELKWNNRIYLIGIFI